MAKTKIEWADYVWNPVTGCSKVSEGCRHCYAEALARRFRKDFKPWTAPNAAHNVRLHPERLEQPLRWKKPRRVFVNSVSDLFHEQVPYHFICKVFHTMTGEASYKPPPRHTYQILTKRPRRMYEFFKWIRDYPGPEGFISALQALWFDDAPPKYVWLGVSAEDQPTFDERAKCLLETPAAKRFVSLEPMLESVDLTRVHSANGIWSALSNTGDDWQRSGAKLDWVIVGGESGPGARPMKLEWVRSIRDQCQAAGVPFFFKQWGAWKPIRETMGSYRLERVGKKAAGNVLDGRTWEEYPS